MKKRNQVLSLVLALSLAATIGGTSLPVGALEAGSETAIVSMQVNSLDNPIIDDASPVFSWAMQSNQIGQKQTAYQIIVTDSDDQVVWDSGKVEDSKSQSIPYGENGDVLQAKQDYSWYVNVWDKDGNVTRSETSTFSMGLMDPTLNAWNGAKWIGADELSLNADTLPVYRISYSMQITSGSKAGFVYGANDPRLNDWTKNDYMIEGENYVYVELDISGLQDEDPDTPAYLNLYRKGYCPEDQQQPDGMTQVASLSLDGAYGFMLTEEMANDSLDIDIVGSSCAALLMVNGTPLKIGDGDRGDYTGSPWDNYTGTGKYAGSIIVNPSKKTHDTPNYPRLNDIGFQTDDSTTAVFSDLEVKAYTAHYGENAVLFGEDTGASYQIFEGLPGVDVDENTISIDRDTLQYADPTYGSIPMLRKDFTAEKEVASAKLYVTARGIYEMYLNGERVGNDWFNPGYTQYDATQQYNVYDVTEQIGQNNTIGAVLAAGWWSDQMTYSVNNHSFWGDKQSLLANLEITYTDGSTQQVVSDESWQYYGDGPITYSASFDGERYDATKEEAVQGWCTSDYDAYNWRNAVEVPADDWYADPDLVVMTDVPVRQVETLQPQDHFEGNPNNSYFIQPYENEDIYVYDMGVNMVGVPEITLPEMPAGSVVMIRYAEIMYPELAQDNPYNYGDLAGKILTENYRAAYNTDFYTCKGTPGGEVIKPRFTFHGYRFIEIRGTNGPLPQESIQGIVLSSIEGSTIEYDTSNELTNQLSKNILRSLSGNHVSIPTDCPQRNERMGWTGDAAVFCRTATYYGDMNSLYRTWENTMRDVQNKGSGSYNNSPALDQTPSDGNNYDASKVSAGVAWPSAGILPVWECYQQYGDLKIVQEHMDSMIRFLDGVCASRNLQNGCSYLTNGSGLAEHLALISTDSNYFMNCITKYLLEAVADMAQAVGRDEKAAEYRERAENMKAEFNDKCIDPETKKPRTVSGVIQDTEAAYAIAIQYGMVNDEYLEDFSQNYVNVCAQGYNNIPFTISTGFYGTGKVLPALTKTGKIQEAYAMFEQTEYASWLYPVVNGATSIWERWNGYTIENGFSGNNGMNSFNHYSAGACGEWMVNYQIGIMNDEENPGFQHFILQPTPGGSFTYVNGAYTSVYGRIESNWTAEDGVLTSYETVVPANTSATLYLPVQAQYLDRFKNIDGVTYRGMTLHNGQTTAKFELQSGGYQFSFADGTLCVSHSKGYEGASSADKTILRSVLAYAEAVFTSDEFDNAISSVQTSFTAALEQARTVDADLEANQRAVDAAWQTLMTEIHKLGFVRGDKSALGELIALAETFQSQLDRYTPVTAEPFTAALSEAKSVYSDGDAMQSDVTAAESSLLEAMLNLRFKADKSILESMLSKAAVIDTTAYTSQSVAAFDAAIGEAKSVFENENATQKEVDSAADKLSSAIDSLVTCASVPAGHIVQGDKALSTGSGNAKTGESTPAEVAFALLMLLGSGYLLGKKKR